MSAQTRPGLNFRIALDVSVGRLGDLPLAVALNLA